MIVTEFNEKHGTCSLIVESSDDLWSLRRLLSKGDVVVSRSSRVVKKDEEYSRPDKGERVSVTVAVRVEDVHLDSSIERLRVRGTIVEASDDSVTKSGSHSITISPGHPITLRKEKWSQVAKKLIRKSESEHLRFLLVAADRREAGVGTLVGTHLTVLTTIESGLGGKQTEESSAKPFQAKVVGFLGQVHSKGDVIVVGGPGTWKNALANQISNDLKFPVKTIEGFDLTGSDGVRAMVKDPAFQEVAQGSALVQVQRAVAEAVRRISTTDGRVAYSLPRVKAAAEAGAVDSCVVSDDVFGGGVDEQTLVDVFNTIEGQGGKVFLADSSLELGKQVSSFGGIVALLRYPLRHD